MGLWCQGTPAIAANAPSAKPLNPSGMFAPTPAPKPEAAAQESATTLAPALGEKIFSANCSACHIGGNNVILSEKNLHKEALEKYAMASLTAIKQQVIQGKNAMPAFGDNLTSAEIEAVARYVLTQSEQDWKGSTADL
ncbi:MAG: c-type cytochrome [Synechococcales bacterium]|nr:c-type cytochrome [Synechococcales bacterium]